MVYFEDLLRCAIWAQIQVVLAGLKSSLCYEGIRLWGTICNVVIPLCKENTWHFNLG